jgi:hypothetical protein
MLLLLLSHFTIDFNNDFVFIIKLFIIWTISSEFVSRLKVNNFKFVKKWQDLKEDDQSEKNNDGNFGIRAKHSLWYIHFSNDKLSIPQGF